MTLKASLHENKNKKMVLEQPPGRDFKPKSPKISARKRIRIEGQLSGHEKEIKELEDNMKHLRPLVESFVWYLRAFSLQ